LDAEECCKKEVTYDLYRRATIYWLYQSVIFERGRGEREAAFFVGHYHVGFVHDRPLYLMCPDVLSKVGELILG
jgi:hypothetical protein